LPTLKEDTGRLDERVTKPDDLEVRLDKLDFRLGELVLDLRDMNSRLIGLSFQLRRVELAIYSIRADFRRLLDRELAGLKTEFRLMFGALLAMGLILAGMMAVGFG
jgi:hypothetical protein